MNRRLGILLLTASALVAYVLWREGGPHRLLEFTESGLETPSTAVALNQTTHEQQSQETEAVALNPISVLRLESTAPMLERPMFNPDRRPRPTVPQSVEVEESVAPISVAEPDENPNGSDYTLLAVTAGPSRHVAAVRLNQNGEVVFLKKGEAVSKWQVLDIGYRDITIGDKNTSIKLQLFTQAADPDNGAEVIASPAIPSVDAE